MSSVKNQKLNISIQLLADYPHLISEIAEIRCREWGQPEDSENLDWWVEVTKREAGLDNIPITWVAIDDLGHALGSIALDEFDIEERHDRSPWVTGVIVEAQHRSMGIGGQLMQVLETWAYQHGYSPLWVGTGGRAVDFYQQCGYELVESITRPSGEVVSILTKSLS